MSRLVTETKLDGNIEVNLLYYGDDKKILEGCIHTQEKRRQLINVSLNILQQIIVASHMKLRK